jgi:hypothetical protein
MRIDSTGGHHHIGAEAPTPACSPATISITPGVCGLTPTSAPSSSSSHGAASKMILATSLVVPQLWPAVALSVLDGPKPTADGFSNASRSTMTDWQSDHSDLASRPLAWEAGAMTSCEDGSAMVSGAV